MTSVLALGGHLLAGAPAPDVRALFDGPLVVTHGNGPQVGELLLHEHVPVWLAVAQTQGELGTELARAFGGVCVVTHVVVDAEDPTFARPTKPIGPAYAEEHARALGLPVVEDPGRGWRRVVPSPRPRRIVELSAIRSLLGTGAVVVACGGGGIPVVERDGRLEGVAAVIDKDRASALLATELRARRLVILTDVPAVCAGFGTPGQSELRELPVAEAEVLLPELAEGSMRPKLEAAVAFARATGKEALITNAESLRDGLAGRAGTLVRA